MNRLERRRLGRRKHLEAKRRIAFILWARKVTPILARALSCEDRPWFRLELAPLEGGPK